MTWEREVPKPSRGSVMRSIMVPVSVLARISEMPVETQHNLKTSLRAIYERVFDIVVKRGIVEGERDE